jgi:hypothetical protein
VNTIAQTHRGSVRLLTISIFFSLLIAADIGFAAFTMTEVVSPSFGMFFSGASGRQFILNTDGTITGTDAADYITGAVAGNLELKQTGGKLFPVNIVAENISTLGGLSVASILCKFQNNLQTTCSGPGINVSLQGKRKLLLGLDISTTQIHMGGTASISFDITVTFL